MITTNIVQFTSGHIFKQCEPVYSKYYGYYSIPTTVQLITMFEVDKLVVSYNEQITTLQNIVRSP